MECNSLKIIKTSYGYKLTTSVIELLITKILNIIISLFIGIIVIIVDFRNINIEMQILIKIIIYIGIIFQIIDTILQDCLRCARGSGLGLHSASVLS